MNLPIEATVNSQNPIFTVKKQEKFYVGYLTPISIRT